MGVLVVFGALASALPLPGTPAEDAPECVREGPHDLLCVWDWRASPGGGMRHWLMPPGVGTSILEMRITTDTVLEFSWGFCIDAGSPNETVAYCPSTVLEHPPPPRGTDRTTTVTRTLVLDFDPALVYHFMIAPTSASLAPTVAPATYHVEGDFRGVSRDIPAGGHAGTPEDPQLRDGAGDTADASVVTGDIRGGWIDQAYLDDRLLEVGLVLPNLEAIDKSGNEESTFTFTFTVLGRSHTVAWLHGGRADDRADGWAAVLFDSNDPVTPSLFSLPTRIDAANGTIRATLALRAVGDPQDGELFSNLSATASRNMAVPGNDHGLVWFTQLDEIEAGKTQDDAATSMVRAFAPGGPAVWEPLRGVEAASVPAPSWKSAPFAPQNLASTLVLGAVLVLVVGGVASTVLVRGRVASLATDARARGIVVAPGALVLGKYRVERALGEGGGGRVYLAQDVRMDRRVVLKVLASQDQAEAIREARAVAAIEHPHVVRIHDVEDLGREALLVMEHVDGGSLKERIAAGGALSEPAFARVADGLLAALDAVHAAGAVHRDVKPGNVLLTLDGRAKLSDFGIARLPGFETTIGPAAAGTVRYMSPEQARGKRVTAASDLYSAAVTLYEARTGRALVEPLPEESAAEMQMRVGAPAAVEPDVEPAALRAWFARALAPDPTARFPDAAEMRAALAAALAT